MSQTFRVAPLCATAVAFHFAAAVQAPASAQPSAGSQGATLPPVVVQQKSPKPAAPRSKPANAAVAKDDAPAPRTTSAGKPSTGGTVRQSTAPAPVAEVAPPPPANQSTVSGVGSTGLAVPATTTVVGDGALTDNRLATSDTATLLQQAPGVSIYRGGGVSGLPAINGLNDDRVKILLNGMVVSSACANHMNPPLSYADPAQVARVEVTSGVTPVSKGGDSIAGTVIVESAPPHFAHAGEAAHTVGSVSAFYRSNGHAVGTSATAHVATDTISVDYAGAWAMAGNYKNGDGDIVRSTEYQAQNHAVQVAVRHGGDVFIVQGGLQFIPYQGFVNQRMDMVDNQSYFLNTRYLGKFSWGKLDARAFYQHVDHTMNFLDDKKYNKALPYREMPMLTAGEDFGYSVKAEIALTASDTLRVGNEFHRQTLDDRWPATMTMVGMMGPDTYVTINHGTRDRLGSFVEWEHKWDRAWTTLLGVRNDTVWMDTGNVRGYNNSAMSVYRQDAIDFNARDHARTDTNFDATALARFEPSPGSIVEFGYAMKTRSPNFYERYAWSKQYGTTEMNTAQMAMNMIGWFGDGNGYTGNLDLKPERAHTASVTFGVASPDNQWGFKVTPYYTYVEDYIGVRKIGDSRGAAHSGPGNLQFVNLQFANHDAELYGVNISGAMPLVSRSDFGSFALTGVAGYVHGENADTGVSLYHMMPFNTRLALTHRLGGWSSALEFELVAGKHNVDTVRNELETEAYALVNVRTSYDWQNWRFDLGVQNLFDTYFEHPLGGHDIEPTMGGRLPVRENKGNVAGQGRSFNVGLTVEF